MKPVSLTMIPSQQLRRNIRYTIGLATGVVGIADMLSVIIPRMEWAALLGESTINISYGVHSLTAVIGFFLLMLSYGLMRGKQQAWHIILALLLLSAVLHILRGATVLTTIITLVLATALLIFRRFFQAKSDPPAAWRGYIALLAGTAIVIFYTVGGFFALYNQFEPMADRLGIDTVLLRLLTHAHVHVAPGSQAFFFERAVSALCLSAVIYGMVLVLRPVAATLLPNEKHRNIAASLTHLYGKSSISYFALTDEKSYFFSASGKTVISYVLEGSVAVVAGDPVGPENELLDAMKEFVAFCNEQDWTIVFWQVRNDLADLYRAADLRLLKIGEDAIIDTSTFTLKGGAIANVRSSTKRAEKDGVRVVFYQGRIEHAEHRIQMERISRAWLAQKGSAEMGFSMGHFDPEAEEQVYAVAVDTDGKVHGFVTFVPIYGRNGQGLDLMRRAEQCAPGTMELLLVRSIEYLREHGAVMVSLGLAPLSNVNNEDETFLDASIDFFTQRAGNLNQRQSLFKFKKKFQPTWESRYLAFSSTLTLPKIGWALYQAHQADASMLHIIRKSLHDWQKNRQNGVLGAAKSRDVVTGNL